MASAASPVPGSATAPASPGAAVVAALEGLARISSASAVYGPDHPRAREVADAVVATVRAAAGGGTVRIVAPATPDGEADLGAGGLGGRLLQEFSVLGISHVDLAADVSGEDLVAFAVLVRRAAAPRSGFATFEIVDFSQLPPSVRVASREFGKPSLDPATHEVANDGSEPAVPAFEEALATAVDEATRALLQRVMDTALAAGTALGPEGGRARLPTDVREAVRAAAEAICRSLRKRSGSSERSVADILGEAGRLLPTVLPASDARTLLGELSRSLDEHMRDAFVTEQRHSNAMARPAHRRPQAPGPPEEELAASIRSFTAGAQAFETVTRSDGAEDLSIVLHVLGDGVAPKDAEPIVRRLAAAASGGIEEPERNVVHGWMRATVARLKPAALDAVVAPVEEALRTSAPGVLAQVFAELCRSGGTSLAESLWPHLAREVLASDDPLGAASREELISILAKVPRSRIHDESPRLVAMLSGRGGAPATSAFSPPRAGLFPLYEVLARLPAETGYSRALVLAFSRHASQYPPAAAFGGLDPGDERARGLLAKMLRARDDSPEVRALAAGILVERLRALPAERRDAPWVDGALRALGGLTCRESDGFLLEVAATRKWLVAWKWPAEARRTAAEVLAQSRAAANAKLWGTA